MAVVRQPFPQGPVQIPVGDLGGSHEPDLETGENEMVVTLPIDAGKCQGDQEDRRQVRKHHFGQSKPLSGRGLASKEVVDSKCDPEKTGHNHAGGFEA